MKILDAEQTGLNIIKQIEKKGIKKYDLADMLCISVPSIYAWKNKQQVPSVDHLVMLADVLECKIDDLIISKEVEYGEKKKEA